MYRDPSSFQFTNNDLDSLKRLCLRISNEDRPLDEYGALYVHITHPEILTIISSQYPSFECLVLSNRYEDIIQQPLGF